MTLHLVQYLAVFLAETITGLLQRVLTHPARGLVDDTNAALLTQKFWVQAIYTELLCASSRHRAVREQEKQRPPTGLVKVCLPYDGAAAQKNSSGENLRMQGLKRCLAVAVGSTLCLWFPASWMPLVVDALREKALHTARMSVSWALLPLLTERILCCRRPRISPTRSNGSVLLQFIYVQLRNMLC